MVYITNNTNFYSTDRHSEYRRIFKCVCVCFDNPINKEKMRATSSNVLAPIVLIVIKKVTKNQENNINILYWCKNLRPAETISQWFFFWCTSRLGTYEQSNAPSRHPYKWRAAANVRVSRGFFLKHTHNYIHSCYYILSISARKDGSPNLRTGINKDLKHTEVTLNRTI